MVEEQQTSDHCRYTYYLNNDIHRLTLLDDSTDAVDDALHYLAQVLDEHPAEQPLRLFIDARVGVPPLNYFFTHLRKLYASREALPPIRAAYVYEKSIVLSVFQAFFAALRINATRRFFRNSSDIEAIEWLTNSGSTPFSATDMETSGS